MAYGDCVGCLLSADLRRLFKKTFLRKFIQTADGQAGLP